MVRNTVKNGRYLKKTKRYWLAISHHNSFNLLKNVCEPLIFFPSNKLLRTECQYGFFYEFPCLVWWLMDPILPIFRPNLVPSVRVTLVQRNGQRGPRERDCSDSRKVVGGQPRPQGFSLKKWVGREKALASAGHVYSLNIPEKLIYMQPAGFALTEGSNNGNNNIANCVNIFACVRFKSLRSI